MRFGLWRRRYDPHRSLDRSAAHPAAKPWIDGIHAYVPGKATGGDGRRWSNCPPTKTRSEAAPRRSRPWRRRRHGATYPDPDAAALRAAIANVHGLDPARIVCGTGSDELLNLAAQAYAGPGDEVVYVRYGFSVYDIAARRCGAMPVVAPDRDYGTDVDALLACVTEQNPRGVRRQSEQPDRQLSAATEIARLHAGLPSDVLLVLDQAYAEYLTTAEDDGGLALAAAHDNVLVTRTFSKIYGLAGERIGWATGAPHLIANLNRIRGPFNVTAPGSGPRSPRWAIRRSCEVARAQYARTRALRRRDRCAGQSRPARRAQQGQFRAGPVRRRGDGGNRA